MQHSMTTAFYCYAQALLLDECRRSHGDAGIAYGRAENISGLNAMSWANCASLDQKLRLKVEKAQVVGKAQGTTTSAGGPHARP
jgi:hypothetical protein